MEASKIKLKKNPKLIAKRINKRVKEEVVDEIDWEEVEEQGVYEADVAFDEILNIILRESGLKLNQNTVEPIGQMIYKLCDKYNIPISMHYEDIIWVLQVHYLKNYKYEEEHPE